MPRELWAVTPEQMEIREYPTPVPGDGEVQIICEYGAPKHGTEMAFVRGYGARRGRFDQALGLFLGPGGDPKPGRVGNMVVGRVSAVGAGVAGLETGDRVLTYSPFREIHVASADRCWKMPEDMSWKTAVCLDPADFAMSAVRDGNVRIGDAVAVFGMGAIGLMVTQLARLAGAHPVIAVEPLENRRRAAEACGADLVLDPGACDVGVETKKATGNRGVDVAIDYSGDMDAMQAALRGVAFGGNVVAGAYPPPYGAGLDLGAEAHLNVPNIIFSRACSEPNREHPRWDEPRIHATCWRLLVEGKLTGEPVVTPVVAFEELVQEYPRIASDPGSNIKLGASFV